MTWRKTWIQNPELSINGATTLGAASVWFRKKILKKYVKWRSFSSWVPPRSAITWHLNVEMCNVNKQCIDWSDLLCINDGMHSHLDGQRKSKQRTLRKQSSQKDDSSLAERADALTVWWTIAVLTYFIFIFLWLWQEERRTQRREWRQHNQKCNKPHGVRLSNTTLHSEYSIPLRKVPIC